MAGKYDSNESDAYYDENKAALNLRWPGDHSETWLRLDEVLSYFANGDRVSKHQGWVTIGQYKVWKEKGRPESWCGFVSGPHIEHVSNKQMDDVLTKPQDFGVDLKTALTDEFGRFYTLVCWTSTYKEDAGTHFIEDFLPCCQKLAADPKNVRLVFNFDS